MHVIFVTDVRRGLARHFFSWSRTEQLTNEVRQPQRDRATLCVTRRLLCLFHDRPNYVLLVIARCLRVAYTPCPDKQVPLCFAY